MKVWENEKCGNSKRPECMVVNWYQLGEQAMVVFGTLYSKL